MRNFLWTAALAAVVAAAARPQSETKTDTLMEKLQLTETWDKTFPQSGRVSHSKVVFTNRYGIALAADLYVPKDASGRLPAIAVCGLSAPSRSNVRGSMPRPWPSAGS